MAKVIVQRLLRAAQFDRLSDRWAFSLLLSRWGIQRSPSALVAWVVYWVILLPSFMVALGTLEVSGLSILVSQFFAYLPNGLIALFILILGYLVGGFLGRAALIAAVNAGVRSASFLSTTVHWMVLALAFTMALSQLEIAEEVVLAAFCITFGGIVLALAIAFGLGGKEAAQEFIEKNLLSRTREEEEEPEDELSHL